jgi:hypothetical protein
MVVLLLAAILAVLLLGAPRVRDGALPLQIRDWHCDGRSIGGRRPATP